MRRDHDVGPLPVVEAGRVVGMLTERDLLRAVETLIQDRVRSVHPLESSAVPAAPKLYQYGFPEPSWEEPWQNETPGL